MEKIELLEKLVEVQEMHIELMQDYNNLKNCYKNLEKNKNQRIDDLNNTIEQQKGEKAILFELNDELNQRITDLKGQIEELQKLIPIEVVGQGQEEKQIKY